MTLGSPLEGPTVWGAGTLRVWPEGQCTRSMGYGIVRGQAVSGPWVPVWICNPRALWGSARGLGDVKLMKEGKLGLSLKIKPNSRSASEMRRPQGIGATRGGN